MHYASVCVQFFALWVVFMEGNFKCVWERMIKMKEKTLTQKEILFCTYYCIKQNGAEAAYKAGYSVMPERAAMKLLRKEKVRERIAQLLRDSRVSGSEVEAGLRRIAFGCIGDAVKIALNENISEDELKAMDLFGVSEIKVSRGKSVEIKFFDRIKALEKLSQLVRDNAVSSTDSFFKAIEEGAGALRAERDKNS